MDLSIACAQLLQKSGQTGKPGSGLIPVWQNANDQGAWDIGYRPDDQLEKVISTADAVYIAGADPAGESPAFANAIEEASFVIVQELFLTETAKLADVVFPVQSIARTRRNIHKWHAQSAKVYAGTGKTPRNPGGFPGDCPGAAESGPFQPGDWLRRTDVHGHGLTSTGLPRPDPCQTG